MIFYTALCAIYHAIVFSAISCAVRFRTLLLSLLIIIYSSSEDLAVTVSKCRRSDEL